MQANSDNHAEFPLVSVVLPVRNGERFVAEAIESVLAQSYRPLELIVIDGHSTDGTAAIVQRFDAVIYRLQDGIGIPQAYNQGLDLARGGLLAWIAHDDLWLPEKLSRQVAALQQNPAWQFVGARLRHQLVEGATIPAGFRRELLAEERIAYNMETLLARSAVFEQVGRFDERYATGIDTDWFARARDLGVPYGAVDRTLVQRRIHELNSSLNSTELSNELLSMMRRSIGRKRAQGKI